MSKYIDIAILLITFCIMLFLFIRYFIVSWKGKHANTKEDMDFFYANDFMAIPKGLAQAVIKQFCPNEQIAAVYAYTHYGKGCSKMRLTRGEKAMCRISEHIYQLSTHEDKGITWDPGVINAIMQVHFDEIKWAEEKKEPTPDRAVHSTVYYFGEDPNEAAAIRKDICTLVDDLIKTPLPFGPAFVRKKTIFCRIYPHYDRNWLSIFDAVRSKLTFGQ